MIPNPAHALDPDAPATIAVPETVTTLKEETLGPSERMLMWHAERSKPDAFGTHLRVIVDSPPALFEPSDEDRLSFLVDDASAFVDDHPDAIDVQEAS